MAADARIQHDDDYRADGASPLAPERVAALVKQAERRFAGLQPKPPLAFRFSWRGIALEARGEARDAGMMLELGADLATVPFSAEDPLLRARLIQLLARIGDCEDCPLARTRQGAVRYRGTAALDPPLTAIDVVAGTVALLLRARPYFDLLEEHCPRTH